MGTYNSGLEFSPTYINDALTNALLNKWDADTDTWTIRIHYHDHDTVNDNPGYVDEPSVSIVANTGDDKMELTGGNVEITIPPDKDVHKIEVRHGSDIIWEEDKDIDFRYGGLYIITGFSIEIQD